MGRGADSGGREVPRWDSRPAGEDEERADQFYRRHKTLSGMRLAPTIHRTSTVFHLCNEI